MVTPNPNSKGFCTNKIIISKRAYGADGINIYDAILIRKHELGLIDLSQSIRYPAITKKIKEYIDYFNFPSVPSPFSWMFYSTEEERKNLYPKQFEYNVTDNNEALQTVNALREGDVNGDMIGECGDTFKLPEKCIDFDYKIEKPDSDNNRNVKLFCRDINKLAGFTFQLTFEDPKGVIVQKSINPYFTNTITTNPYYNFLAISFITRDFRLVIFKLRFPYLNLQSIKKICKQQIIFLNS